MRACASPRARAACSTPTPTRSWKAAPTAETRPVICPWSRTARSGACSSSCSSSTASGCPTGPWTSSRSARSTRSSWASRSSSRHGRSLALRTKAKHGAASWSTSTRCSRRAPDKRAKALADLEVAKLTDREAQGLKAARSVHELADALERKVDRDATPGPRAGRHAGAPADRRAPALGLALHAALADPADRRRDAAPDPRAPGPAGDARADPGPQGARPGHGLGRLPGRGLPPARRGPGQGLGGARDQARPAAGRGRAALRQAPDRPALPLRRRQERHGGRARQALALARDARQATTSSPSSTTASATATRWSASIPPADRRARLGTRARARPARFTDYLVKGAIEKAERERERIREHLDDATEEDLRPLLDRADRYLDDVRADRRRDRRRVLQGHQAGGAQARRARGAPRCVERRSAAGRRRYARSPPSCAGASTRSGRSTGEIELPEVFDRDNPGFDAIVGNPPFAGKNNIISAQSRRLPRLAEDAARRARTATPTSSPTSSAAPSACCAEAAASA